MHVRHTIQPSRPLNLIDIRLNQDNSVFTVSTPTGFAIYRTWPLALLRKRDISNGTLAIIQPIHTTSLLLLVGGRRTPRYPPNKVVLWDDALGHEVAEIEFRERVLGLASRREWIAVALKRRVVVYQLEEGGITRFKEYETSPNMRGLISIANSPTSTLLAMPGRQPGHVQLIHLPPCPSPPPPPTQPPPSTYDPPPPIPAPAPPPVPTHHSRAPISIIAAHKAPLTTLSVPSSGRLLATTSESGTLVRIWDAYTGELVKELRRGSDKAEIYGVAFRPDEREVAVWSDKGTVHVFKIAGGDSGGSGAGGASGGDGEGNSKGNRQSTLQQLTPYLPISLPKYFHSEWSYASYRLPAPSAHIALSSALRGGDLSSALRGGEERGDGGKKKRDKDAEAAGGIAAVDEEAGVEKCVVGWVAVPVRVPIGAASSRPPSARERERERGKGRAGSVSASPRSRAAILPDVNEEDPQFVEEMQYQLVVLTYSGCWYRLSVPSGSSASPTTATGRSHARPVTPTQSSKPQTPAPIPIPTANVSRHSRSGSQSGTQTPSPLRGSPPSLSSPPRSPPFRTMGLGMGSTPPRPSPLHAQHHPSHGAPASVSTAATATTAATARASVSTAVPTPRTSSKGKEKEKERKDSAGTGGAGEKVSRKLNMEEFRRFGRWDGWI
ncbi:hypothetical protein DL93DRAFT_2086042 [Clavulina sp. PMI_390]|nr:hypothetical protein DL93DRAFT_2086042 [Clavulina sp. PMI_390]